MSEKKKRVYSKHRKTLGQKTKLILNPTRINKFLNLLNGGNKVSTAFSICVTSAIQYIVAELLEEAFKVAATSKKKMIIPRHLRLAVDNDADMTAIFKNCHIMKGGVRPGILSTLVPPVKATPEPTVQPSE